MPAFARQATPSSAGDLKPGGTLKLGVQGDPALLSLYPEPEDLGPARHKLTMFLEQYWGGPTTYQ